MRFINLEKAFGRIKGVPNYSRIEMLLRAVGCEFYEPGLLKRPVVGIVGIGGLPVTSEDPLEIGGMPTSPERLRASFSAMRGLAGCLTYMNPRERTPVEMTAVQLAAGHGSAGHACFVNVGVFGLTSAVEHEFDCQRDLLHLARVTVARTKVQSSPPLVVLDEKRVNLYRRLREEVWVRHGGSYADGDADSLEAMNVLWPKASATAVMLSGSLRNFAKLVAQKDDGGKEAEYVRLLTAIDATLAPLDSSFA